MAAFLIIPKAGVRAVGPPRLATGRCLSGGLTGVSEGKAATFSRAPVADAARSRASLAERLEHLGLRPPSPARRQARQGRAKGRYMPLGGLDVTVADVPSEKTIDDAKGELSEEYDVVPDFDLMLVAPERAEGTVIRGLSVLAAPEWPEASGVRKAHAAGIKGGGVRIGVLDTGVDADHCELSHRTITYRYIPFFPMSPNWSPRDVRGFDVDGHGTHVCGIAAGSKMGVAPECTLHVASVIESETTKTSLIRVTYGLNWLLEQFSLPPHADQPAIVNMSLGFPSKAPKDITKSEFKQRIEAMRLIMQTLLNANVLPVVAMGNGGASTWGYPAAFAEALSVGAVDFKGKVAKFSGGGTIAGVGSKPDIVGHGVAVYSSLERSYDNDCVYTRLSGTSMAAPYVAGIAALYWCMHPNLDALAIRDMVLGKARKLPGSKTRVGTGLARFAS